MIVVTLGTNEWAFDRLVRAARTLPADNGLLVQYGSSREPHGEGTWVDFLSFDELSSAMRDAKVVVAHAGTGSVLLARQCGHRPIVVPRLGAKGEAVDDHQVHFARRVAARGMVRLVEDEGELAAVVADELKRPYRVGKAVGSTATASSLASEIGEYLSGLVTSRSA